MRRRTVVNPKDEVIRMTNGDLSEEDGEGICVHVWQNERIQRAGTPTKYEEQNLHAV